MDAYTTGGHHRTADLGMLHPPTSRHVHVIRSPLFITNNPLAAKPGTFTTFPAQSPTYTFAAGGESRDGAGNGATVIDASGATYRAQVRFAATGDDRLPHPDTSCLRIDTGPGGVFTARPLTSTVDVDTPGRYEGVLEFPAFVSGDYTFVYGCDDTYAPATVGTAQVPSAGVARLDATNYVVVLAVEGLTVRFAAHGDATLPDPVTSCLIDGDRVRVVDVAVDYRNQTARSSTFTGSATSPDKAPKGTAFHYGCAADPQSGIPVR